MLVQNNTFRSEAMRRPGRAGAVGPKRQPRRDRPPQRYFRSSASDFYFAADPERTTVPTWEMGGLKQAF